MPTEMTNTSYQQREYSIDLLRMMAMTYVIILHTLGHGGILRSTIPGSSQYMMAWFMEVWAYCAVDVFAIVSGYTANTHETTGATYSRYIVLWAEVVYYGIIIAVGLWIWDAELVTRQDMLMSCLPVLCRRYWYFTAFTGFVVLKPIINATINSLSQKQLKIMLCILIIAFSFFDSISKPFNLNRGYSPFWLLILYLIGAAIKRCNIGKTWK